MRRDLDGLQKVSGLFSVCSFFSFPLQMDDKASCAPVKFQPIHQGRKCLNGSQDNRRCSLFGSEVTVSCCSGHTKKKNKLINPSKLIYLFFLLLCINSTPPPNPRPPAPPSPESAPRPGAPRPHSHAPLGRPALECRSWGRISLQALNMSHVSRRAAADREV